MSNCLLDNQKFSKKITYYQNMDDEKKVTIALSLSCNHDINKTIVSNIEQYISNLFLNDYISEDKYKENKNKNKQSKKEDKQLLAYKKRMNIGD